MALSTVALKTLRADLRIRLGEISDKEFRSAELNRWLNLGCFDAAVQLVGISSAWFLGADETTSAVSGQATDINDLGIMRIDKVVSPAGYADPGTRTVVPLVEIDELEGYDNNAILQPGGDTPTGVGLVCAHWGENLYFSDSSADDSIFRITFVKRPTKMSADTDCMDVLAEFQDLVIMFAQVKAMQKKGLLEGRSQLEQDIAGRIEGIRKAYLGQMAFKEVGRMIREGTPNASPQMR